MTSNLEIFRASLEVMEKLVNDTVLTENTRHALIVPSVRLVPYDPVWDRCNCTSVGFTIEKSKNYEHVRAFHSEVMSGRFKKTIKKKFGDFLSIDAHTSDGSRFKISSYVVSKVVVQFRTRSQWLEVLAGKTANYKTKVNNGKTELVLRIVPGEYHEATCQYRPLKIIEGRIVDRRTKTAF